MGRLERNLLQSTTYKPFSWLRIIHDIEVKWVENRDCLKLMILLPLSTSFIVLSNSQLTYLVPKNILDTTLTLEDVNMKFSLNTTPTDSHLFFKPYGFHPPHTFRYVSKGLATRIKTYLLF